MYARNSNHREHPLLRNYQTESECMSTLSEVGVVAAFLPWNHPSVSSNFRCAIGSQSWRPSTEVQKPWLDKSTNSRRAGPKGAEGSAEKVLRASRLCRGSGRARGPKHFFGTFLDTRFGPALSEKSFLALLSGLRRRHFCSWSPGL